jgi:hypothetical protein
MSERFLQWSDFWNSGLVPWPARETSKAVYVLLLIRSARTGFSWTPPSSASRWALASRSRRISITSRRWPTLRCWSGSCAEPDAVMHGSTTTIFAILSKGLTDRHDSEAILWFVPGLVAASGIHSVFNHFILPPVLTTAVLLAVVPLLVIGVFQRSQEITGRWLGAGFDSDTDLLEQIVSGEIRHTRVGRYLQSLRERFPGSVVADMLCLLQIHLELSLRAKGILLAREAGLQVPVGEDVRPKLDELALLEKSIGHTGRLAIRPLLKTHRRDLWELYVLGR